MPIGAVAEPAQRTKPNPLRYFKTSQKIIWLAVMLYDRYPRYLVTARNRTPYGGIRLGFPPVSWKLSAALLFLYLSGGRDRTMVWDIHRNVKLLC